MNLVKTVTKVVLTVGILATITCMATDVFRIIEQEDARPKTYDEVIAAHRKQ